MTKDKISHSSGKRIRNLLSDQGKWIKELIENISKEGQD